jgi:hypothetical protein
MYSLMNSSCLFEPLVAIPLGLQRRSCQGQRSLGSFQKQPVHRAFEPYSPKDVSDTVSNISVADERISADTMSYEAGTL